MTAGKAFHWPVMALAVQVMMLTTVSVVDDDSMSVNCIVSVYITPCICYPHTCTQHETALFVLFTLTKLNFTTLYISHSAANPCAKLGRPVHGNITCTGIQVTDESCSFNCDLGYRLQGSDCRQ